MELFLSWSKDESKELAGIFRDWIPLVLQNCNPFMSQQDIELGDNWNQTINDKLRCSSIGILFITPENINSPWLNFEAGALSKSLESAQKIIPILFSGNEAKIILSESPLKQFQSVIKPNKKEIKKLIDILNKSMEKTLDETAVSKIFEKWWPDLESQLKSIEKRTAKRTANKTVNETTTIDNKENEEILLNLVQKVDLLTKQNITSKRLHPNVVRDLEIGLKRLDNFDFIEELSDDGKMEYFRIIRRLKDPIDYIRRNNIRDLHN